MHGAEEAHRALLNEALYGVLRILGLIIPTYLHVQFSAEQIVSEVCQGLRNAESFPLA